MAKTQPQKTDASTKSAIYTAATTRLRKAHRKEFEGYVAEGYEQAGLTYNRRLTDKEKAERDLRAILDRFPDLTPVEQAQVDQPDA